MNVFYPDYVSWFTTFNSHCSAFGYHVREFYESTRNIYFLETFFYDLFCTKSLKLDLADLESGIQGFVKRKSALVLQQTHIIHIFYYCKSFLVQARQVHSKKTIKTIYCGIQNTKMIRQPCWFSGCTWIKVNINSILIIKYIILYLLQQKFIIS